MKTLKFVSKDRGQFTATLRKNVNDYFIEKGISTKGNLKMVFKSITMIAVYIVPFILMLTLPLSGWVIFPLSVAMGIGMAGIGMSVMHDAVHGSFSKKGWLNKLFGTTMYFIGGNTFNWKVQHNMLHHTYTNIEGFDEDIEPKGSLRLSKHRPLKKIHRFQYIYAFFLYCFMSLSRIFTETRQLIKYNKAGITKQQGSTPKKEMVKLILGKITYLAIILGLPLIFSGFSWWLIILGFLIMHFIAGIFMSTVFQMAHLVEEVDQPLPNKEGIIENEWTIHELETTANFSRGSRLLGWMIGGLNFQIEHHLFPNICHVHYRAISPIVERTVKEFGLRYNQNRTFFGAIASHIRMLRALGK
ncbi:MAG TPA: acyl-CoA desaturase [Bacteroidia bacterium]|nr:acyl-CoA desaturase [Bacteroidia bacterium]